MSTENTNKPYTVSCPTCQKTVIWNTDFPFKPFCSERCKQIDLGAWASGDYAIPVNNLNPANEDESELDEF